MRVSKLHVSNYRCFKRIELNNLDKIVCLVGANGSGKSSILDLIALICGTNGGRNRFVQNEWDGNVEDKTLILDIDMSENDKKVIQVPKDLLTDPKDNTFNLVNIDTTEFGGRDSFHNRLLNNIRDYTVVYSPIRSFLLEDYGEPRVPDYDERLYRLPEVQNFQNRARRLTAMMTKLLNQQRENLSIRVSSGEMVNASSYKELDVVHDVFKRFFKITGKAFSTPSTADDGRTAFYFDTPWSSGPLPLSALSSGEQWVLFFFLEMKLNNWQNHVILIDEIENHLHPRLAIEFIKELQTAKDNNQYWITTHSPTIARYLKGCTLGLVLNEDLCTEVVTADSISLLSSLAGHEAVIPIAKTIVLLEGSTIPGQALSVDENFFEDLGNLGINLDHVQFVSVGHASSVMDMGQALPDFERRLGLGWKVYAIRDRDAMSDQARTDTMKAQDGRLWIWECSSLEGYLVEPAIVRSLLQSKRVTPLPNKATIENRILEHLENSKGNIIDRYEQHLVFLNFPNRGASTLQWLHKTNALASNLQKDLDDFNNFVNESLALKEWRNLLPFVDCKKLLERIYGRWLQKGFSKPKDVVDLVRSIMRDVIRESLDKSTDKLSTLEKIWPEVTQVLRCLSKGSSFPI